MQRISSRSATPRKISPRTQASANRAAESSVLSRQFWITTNASGATIKTPVASPIHQSGQAPVKVCDNMPNQASVALPTVALTTGATPAPRTTKARTSRKVSNRTDRFKAQLTSEAPITASRALPTYISMAAGNGLWNHRTLLSISAKHPARSHHGQLCLWTRASVAMKSPLGAQKEIPVPGTIARACAKPQPRT